MGVVPRVQISEFLDNAFFFLSSLTIDHPAISRPHLPHTIVLTTELFRATGRVA